METGNSISPWITVIVAAIVAISTLVGAFLTNWFSHKRFKVELGRAIDVDNRKRKWEVRSRQLLALREELAVMTAGLKTLIIDTRGQHYRSDIADEEKNKEFERAIKDLKVNLENGDFLKTLNIQYDNEILQVVDNIVSSYSLLFEYALNYERLKLDLKIEFNKISQEIETKIPEVQELINKKLEEL